MSYRDPENMYALTSTFGGDRPLGRPSSPFDDHRRAGQETRSRYFWSKSQREIRPCPSTICAFPRPNFLFPFWFPQNSNALSAIVMESMKPQKWRGRKTNRVSTSEKDKKKRNPNKQTKTNKRAQKSPVERQTMSRRISPSLQRRFCCLAILLLPSARAIVIHCSCQRRFVMLCNRRRSISAQGWQVFNQRWAPLHHQIIPPWRVAKAPQSPQWHTRAIEKAGRLTKRRFIHLMEREKFRPFIRLTNSI